MRIDPFRGSPYAIPPNNPFVNQAPKRPEIFSYGFRNPWRFSFDRLTGDLTLGDVGQDTWEEVDYAPLASGGGNGSNFGWSCYEATHVYRTDGECNPLPVQVPPVLEYRHGSRGCSITGGYVVRDPELPTMFGRYLFGDYCTGRIYSKVLSEPSDELWTNLTIPGLASFGEDACGHVYALSNSTGMVYRIRDTTSPPPGCAPPFPHSADRHGRADIRHPPEGRERKRVGRPLHRPGDVHREGRRLREHPQFSPLRPGCRVCCSFHLPDRCRGHGSRGLDREPHGWAGRGRVRMRPA